MRRNLRLPLHGIAVPQPDGTITLGLNVVQFAGGQPVSIEAGINLATLGGTWRDSAGNAGTLVFNSAPTGGAPRAGPIQSPPMPNTFSLSPNGNFVVVAGAEKDFLPVRGRGSRMIWDASKSAFRAGFAVGSDWDQEQLGPFSAAFGNGAYAGGVTSFAAGLNVTAGRHLFHELDALDGHPDSRRQQPDHAPVRCQREGALSRSGPARSARQDRADGGAGVELQSAGTDHSPRRPDGAGLQTPRSALAKIRCASGRDRWRPRSQRCARSLRP